MVVRNRFEAIDWMLFGGGGIVAALVLPIHIIATNVLPAFTFAPTIFTQYQLTAAKVGEPLIKLYLILVLSLSTWHATHRVRFILFDLGLVKHRGIVTQASMVTLGAIIIFLIIALV